MTALCSDRASSHDVDSRGPLEPFRYDVVRRAGPEVSVVQLCRLRFRQRHQLGQRIDPQLWSDQHRKWNIDRFGDGSEIARDLVSLALRRCLVNRQRVG